MLPLPAAPQHLSFRLLAVIETIPSMLWSTSPVGEATQLIEESLNIMGLPQRTSLIVGGSAWTFSSCQARLAADPPDLTETNASIERTLRDIRLADKTVQHIRALFKRELYERSDECVPDILREPLRFVHENPKKRGGSN